MKLAQQPRRDMDKTTRIGLAWRISEQGIVWHPGMTLGNKFFYKIVDMQLDFERDAGGKVVAVVLHENGGHIRAPRVVTR